MSQQQARHSRQLRVPEVVGSAMPARQCGDSKRRVCQQLRDITPDDVHGYLPQEVPERFTRY